MSEAQKAKHPGGRPSKRTPEVVEEIARRLAHGEPLARICADEHMPDFSTVWRWEEEDEGFRKISLRARVHGTHFLADDCIRISDDPTLEPSDKKVRIDTRLRLIGKWNAKAYGEKVTNEHVGADGGPIRTERVERLIVDPAKPA